MLNIHLWLMGARLTRLSTSCPAHESWAERPSPLQNYPHPLSGLTGRLTHRVSRRFHVPASLPLIFHARTATRFKSDSLAYFVGERQPEHVKEAYVLNDANHMQVRVLKIHIEAGKFRSTTVDKRTLPTAFLPHIPRDLTPELQQQRIEHPARYTGCTIQPPVSKS